MTISTKAAFLRLLCAGSTVLAVACGGGTPSPKDPPSTSGSGTGSRKDLHDDNGSAGPGKADSSTAALLDKLLAETPSAGHKPPPASPPPAAPTPPTAAAAAHASSDDTFDDDVKRIQETVPGWDNGSGITARFLKESTGKHLSLIYVDPTPPVFNKDVGYWVIEGKAKLDGKVVGTFAILLKTLEAGRFEGSPEKKNAIIISSVGEKMELKANDTMWSTNTGSWCEVVLRPGKRGKHLEGNFRAKLMSNDGQSFQSVESGYVYINQ